MLIQVKPDEEIVKWLSTRQYMESKVGFSTAPPLSPIRLHYLLFKQFIEWNQHNRTAKKLWGSDLLFLLNERLSN